jgi:ATP-dependent Clp protease adaptor protein ClpS
MIKRFNLLRPEPKLNFPCQKSPKLFFSVTTEKNYIFVMHMANTNTIFQEEKDVLTISEECHQLIVWNDDVNTFDWVIETLVEVCGHTAEQAEQCSLIIHHKGKCAVKSGSYDLLKPQCEAITERGLAATIEVVA